MCIHNIPFYDKKKITLDYSESAAMGFFSWGLKNELEIAVVNEPSVFEPLKFYCIILGVAEHSDKGIGLTSLGHLYLNFTVC